MNISSHSSFSSRRSNSSWSSVVSRSRELRRESVDDRLFIPEESLYVSAEESETLQCEGFSSGPVSYLLQLKVLFVSGGAEEEKLNGGVGFGCKLLMMQNTCRH
ncbi:unnamed protein product [Pleuronectes platessa]|uniref:Uncharacterized protein n=1 Tax=Pleuronectes platessa TaxID=8262 RepID=A0A9N7U0M4_PLEPL|nr:unnamed protein product [Pleuronectes platessa]